MSGVLAGHGERGSVRHRDPVLIGRYTVAWYPVWTAWLVTDDTGKQFGYGTRLKGNAVKLARRLARRDKQEES
jgi:hypothetical protein